MSQSSQTQKTKTTGWAPAMKQAEDVALPGALDQYNQTRNSPLWTGAQGAISRMLDPSFADPMNNPYFRSAYDTTADDIQSRVSAQYGRAGRGSGNTAVGSDIARGIAAGFAPTLAGTYQQNLGLQQQAAGMAPGLVSDPAFQQYLANIGGLAGLGQDSTARTTATGSPLQTIAGLGLTAAGVFGGGGLGPLMFGPAAFGRA
jgi:hypothetical protein